MTSADYWHTATVLVGGVGTLAIFSFLIRENPFFRLFEHLFIGIAAGFGLVLSVKNFLWPKVLAPMLGLDIVTWPDGSVSHEYDPRLLLYALPMAFGLFYYFLYSRRYAWLAKLVIGFSLGMSGGLAFKGFFNQIMPQVVGSFKPLAVFEDGALALGSSLENAFFVFTLLAVMYYFFFSFRHENRAADGLSLSGRWLLMVCFGAFFGSTVMARTALLVERVQFLLIDWYGTLARLVL